MEVKYGEIGNVFSNTTIIDKRPEGIEIIVLIVDEKIGILEEK